MKHIRILILLLAYIFEFGVFAEVNRFRLSKIECTSTISVIAYITLVSTEYKRKLKHPTDILNCELIPKLVYNLLEVAIKTKALLRPIGQKFGNKAAGILSIANSETAMDEKLDLLERLAIPAFAPVIYKNEESVLLQVNPSKLNVFQEVLMSSFGRKLKYKAVFGWNELSQHSPSELPLSRVYSSCVFCSSPQTLIPLDHIPALNADLWTDYQQNFHGSALRISTPPAGRPRLNYTLGVNGTYQMQNGLLTYVLRYAQRKLNFSINLKPAARGGGTGTQLQNGTWTGIMSEILHGEVDIGMITAETYSRTKIVGFTRGIVVESVVLVTGLPKKIFVWESIFWPLKTTAWITLILAIIVSVIMMSFSSFILERVLVDSDINQNRLGICDTTEFILKTLLNQSTSISSLRSATMQICIVVWLLCGTIVTSAYLSKLVGFLTFPVLEKVPQTAKELGESLDYSWALTYLGGAAHALIKGTKSKSYEQISRKLELETNFVRCLIRTLESKFVCISYQTVPKFYLNNRIDLQPGQSPFMIAPEPLLSLPVGMSMEKRAVFSPNFDDVVGRIETAGLIPVWEQMDFRKIRKAKWENVRKRYQENMYSWGERIDGESDSSSLTLNHFKGAFVIIIFGSLISIVILFLEVLFLRYNRYQFNFYP